MSNDGFFPAILGIVSVGLIGFSIYFIFKLFQFIIVSVDLYKKMIENLKNISDVLYDIRDNTKLVKRNPSSENVSNEESTFSCDQCKAEVDSNANFCHQCGAKFE